MNRVWTKTFKVGEKWSGNIGKGKYICFKSLGKDANMGMMIFNSKDKTEKYNMPDTLKGQHTAHLTKGNILMSDNGRVLMSIVEDTTGWNDTISGYTTREMTDKKYGKTTYQDKRNDWQRSGEENFLTELIRNNMSRRDMSPCVNLFSKVYVEEDGSMHYAEGHSDKGDMVLLRTEMDVLIVLSNTPNPLDDSDSYKGVEIVMDVYEAEEVSMTDVCVNNREENYRAFQNTWDYYNLLGE